MRVLVLWESRRGERERAINVREPVVPRHRPRPTAQVVPFATDRLVPRDHRLTKDALWFRVPQENALRTQQRQPSLLAAALILGRQMAIAPGKALPSVALLVGTFQTGTRHSAGLVRQDASAVHEAFIRDVVQVAVEESEN